MKRILITGKNSYIGNSLIDFLGTQDYYIEVLDVRKDEWYSNDFSGFDVVVNVAGIAHIKETKDNEGLYYAVNRDLSIKIAQKAKESGVKQFLVLSSMSVYGMDEGVITKTTIPNPRNAYGKSKLQADLALQKMACNSFKVGILRPPMVYGKGCKGNFQSLVKIVNLIGVFPLVSNRRSAIHIDNLVNFIKIAIDKEIDGIYCPQNKEYICTSNMAQMIADTIGKNIIISKFAGWMVKLLIPNISILRKAFGDLVYRECDEVNFNYCIVDFEESIKKSV